MRLVLDEQMDRALAAELRALGHELIAVTERAELRGSSDDALLDWAAGERRALVTRDYTSLRPMLQERLATGRPTWGVVFVSRSFVPARSGTGRTRDALARILRDHPGEDELRDREFWLRPNDP